MTPMLTGRATSKPRTCLIAVSFIAFTEVDHSEYQSSINWVHSFGVRRLVAALVCGSLMPHPLKKYD